MTAEVAGVIFALEMNRKEVVGASHFGLKERVTSGVADLVSVKLSVLLALLIAVVT